MEKLKPQVSKETVKSLINQYYGLVVDEIEEMNGYDDCNYYCKSKDDLLNQGTEFTFKVTNHLETEEIDLLESLNDLSLYIAQNGIKAPVPVKNLNGNYLERIRLNEDSNRRNAIRLFTFIPGILFVKVDYTAGLLSRCGEEFAKLNKVLTNYSNETIKKRVGAWAMENVMKVEPYLDELDNLDRQKMIQKILNDFKMNVLDKRDQFTEAIIHDDLNEQNLLVRKLNDDYELAGILDFNDVNHSIRIFDIAIFCAYCMLNDKCTMQFMEMPKHILRSYCSNIEVSEQEIEIIPLIIKARLSQSLMNGNHFYKLDPTNDYVLETSKTGWSVLSQLDQIKNEDLIKLWLG